MKYLKIKRPDTKEIHDLVRLFCEETGADSEALETIINRLPKMHIFAALTDRIVGIGGYFTIGDKAIFDFLYVAAPYRDQSIAGRLHRMATKHAKSIGMKRVVIFTHPDTADRYLKLKYQEKFRVLERGI